MKFQTPPSPQPWDTYSNWLYILPPCLARPGARYNKAQMGLVVSRGPYPGVLPCPATSNNTTNNGLVVSLGYPRRSNKNAINSPHGAYSLHARDIFCRLIHPCHGPERSSCYIVMLGNT